MNIPSKFQVFPDHTVQVSPNDQARLNPHRTGWRKLHELFLLEALTTDDLRKLVVLELMDFRREQIIGRLLMRLGRLERREIERRIASCLKKN
jgi:hypothetical protein